MFFHQLRLLRILFALLIMGVQQLVRQMAAGLVEEIGVNLLDFRVLVALAQGLGGVWLGIAPMEDRMKAVEEIMEMPDTLHAFGLFPLGYPAEERAQQDRYDESRIHYVE